MAIAPRIELVLEASLDKNRAACGQTSWNAGSAGDGARTFPAADRCNEFGLQMDLREARVPPIVEKGSAMSAVQPTVHGGCTTSIRPTMAGYRVGCVGAWAMQPMRRTSLTMLFCA